MSDMEHGDMNEMGSTGDAQGQQAPPNPSAEEWGPLDDDPLITESTEKKKHSGVLVLVLVVGVAVGSLFSMHTLTKVTAASGRNTEIERTIDNFLGSVAARSTTNPDGSGGGLADEHQRVVETLTNSFTDNQVNQLLKNPFDIGAGAIVLGDMNDEDFARAARRDQIERAAESLKLKSVIMGRRPLANINGKIVRLKQTINIALKQGNGSIKFRIIKITADSVIVLAEYPKIDLKVEKEIKLNKTRR